MPQGLSADADTMVELLQEADDSDLVISVNSTTRPDRDMDRKALDALRDHFTARLQRREPPILIVLTHIDQLRPFQQWSPPYDLLDEGNAKVVSIGDAAQVDQCA